MPGKALVIRDRHARLAAYDASCDRFYADLDAAYAQGGEPAARELLNAALRAGRTFMFGRETRHGS